MFQDYPKSIRFLLPTLPSILTIALSWCIHRDLASQKLTSQELREQNRRWNYTEPDIKSADILKQTYDHDPYKTEVYALNATYMVPANLFRMPRHFRRGQKIKLHISEIYNPVDYLLLGMDLTWLGHQQHGKTVQFESEVMFRIEAFLGKVPLKIKPGASVLVSYRPDFSANKNGFNFYKHLGRPGYWDQLSKDILNNLQTGQAQTKGAGNNSLSMDGEEAGHVLFKILDTFTWYNVDKPVDQFACFSVHPGDQGLYFYSVGISRKTLFTGTLNINGKKAIKALPNGTVKVIALDRNNQYLASEIMTSGKNHDTCPALPKLKPVSITKAQRKDRDMLAGLLGI